MHTIKDENGCYLYPGPGLSHWPYRSHKQQFEPPINSYTYIICTMRHSISFKTKIKKYIIQFLSS